MPYPNVKEFIYLFNNYVSHKEIKLLLLHCSLGPTPKKSWLQVHTHTRPLVPNAWAIDLNVHLCLSVQCRGGLVKDNNTWILDERPGYGHPLLLSSRKFEPLLPNKCLVAFRKANNGVMNICHFSGLLNLLLCSRHSTI